MSTISLNGHGEGTATARIELEEREVFDVLSNERRWYVYHYLDNHPDELVSLRELVDYVAACEYEKPTRNLTSDERNRVSTALNQFHLPKMDECGFVEFDSLRKEARLTEEARDLTVYLDVVPGRDVPWAVYYVGLAVLNTAVVGGVLLDAPGLSLVPSEGWLVFVVAALLASALAHLWYTYRGRLVDDETLPGPAGE